MWDEWRIRRIARELVMPGPSFAKLQYMQALQTTKSRPAKGSGGMIPRYGGMLLRGIWESFDPSKDIP